MMMNYNPTWLKLALETVLKTTIVLGAKRRSSHRWNETWTLKAVDSKRDTQLPAALQKCLKPHTVQLAALQPVRRPTAPRNTVQLAALQTARRPTAPRNFGRR